MVEVFQVPGLPGLFLAAVSAASLRYILFLQHIWYNLILKGFLGGTGVPNTYSDWVNLLFHIGVQGYVSGVESEL